ncbi:acyl-CoA dehydrogenase family protein [Paenibacillus sp.]|jgi:alkylation response protein AidB-like acyl-CoA dehydrogenase|uniref:acyl-CoA dehydrogenase family protein n=1 Tax=Paenibacillus sp. TaxID=58172 RepID=UPI002828CDCF|nr:acyl-CoA dehydrogenase family protein [Paenibacillus sp.]MDR0270541.1 acyl-CoA/acyl-ACP dehydrogenase [Paenibacillus sp.]
MSSIQSDPFVRNERECNIASRSEMLAAVFAKRAALHDREGSFPFENFEGLREAGYLKLTLPQEFGGEEASLYEMLLAQERLAQGDGSTALAVGWHVSQMLQLRIKQSWPRKLYAEFCKAVADKGAMINQFASEPSTGSPSRGGRPQTTAVKTKGGYLITGRKTFSSLIPVLEQFTVTAFVENEGRKGTFFVRKGKGVSIDETWDTLGMRGTGSHDLLLDSVFVPEEERIDGCEGGEGATAETGMSDHGGALLHVPACYIGIAWAARDFAIKFAAEYRPNSLPGPIAELPHIQQKIGEMESELITARTLLYSVADRWDRLPKERPSMKPELGLSKTMATNAAMRIVDLAMRIVGGSSLSRSLPLERMYRDVRAGLHNPPMDDSVIAMLAQRAISEMSGTDSEEK